MLSLTLRHVLDSSFLYIRHNWPLLWTLVDNFTLILAGLLRLFVGTTRAQGVEKCHRPAKPLELYQYEACPFCLKVRETLSILDIDHLVYPCPRETFKGYGVCLNSRFRQEARKQGGSCMFPFLVDPNTEVMMYHSDDIITYLWKTYGDKATKSLRYRILNCRPVSDISLPLWSLCRPCLDMGIFRAASRNPEKTLELWGYVGSSNVKRVEEALSTLELPYLYHVMPYGSIEKRKEFKKAHTLSNWRQHVGLCKVPFLYDPNTNSNLFESKKIVEYLKKQYQTAPVAGETWLDYKPA